MGKGKILNNSDKAIREIKIRSKKHLKPVPGYQGHDPRTHAVGVRQGTGTIQPGLEADDVSREEEETMGHRQKKLTRQRWRTPRSAPHDENQEESKIHDPH